MFWVMRQPTWHMRFRRDRADCGDRGPPRSALSRDRGDRIIPRFSFLFLDRLLYPPACPAGTIGAVPFRVAVTRRARRGNTFQGDQRKVERRNASKTNARPEPPATCTLPLPGTCMPARRSLSAVSVSRSRLAGPARREQLERRDPPPGGRGRGRCAVPPDHTPAGPPGPARAAIGPASARVESPYVDVPGGPRSDLIGRVHVPRL